MRTGDPVPSMPSSVAVSGEPELRIWNASVEPLITETPPASRRNSKPGMAASKVAWRSPRVVAADRSMVVTTPATSTSIRPRGRLPSSAGMSVRATEASMDGRISRPSRVPPSDAARMPRVVAVCPSPTSVDAQRSGAGELESRAIGGDAWRSRRRRWRC